MSQPDSNPRLGPPGGSQLDPSPAPEQSRAPDFSSASEPSYAQSLIWAPDGLRPGWGLAAYFLTYYLLKTPLVEAAYSHDFGASGLWTFMLVEVASLTAAFVPSFALAAIERRSWGTYGFPLRKSIPRSFFAGASWGFASVSFLILLLLAAHTFQLGHIVLHGARLARFAAFWTLQFLLVGFFEEFLVRGYSQFTLARGIGFWPSAVTLSCAFAILHLDNEGERWPGLLAVFCIGMFLCLTLRRTGNLWFAIAFHAAWDWGETFFYSVPDSGMVAPGHLLSSSLRGKAWLTGGSVGPEGSVFCFLVIALTAVAFSRAYPARP